MPDPTPIDVVRMRYPLVPDQDADGLQAQAEQLAVLRGHVDAEQLRDVVPAMTFDPRGEQA